MNNVKNITYDILIILPMFVDTHGVVPTSIYDFFAIAGRTERSKDLPGFLLRSEKKVKCRLPLFSYETCCNVWNR